MFWSNENQSDQNTSQTIISNAQIKKLQFYQLLGIPLPSLILGLIGLNICFMKQCGLMAIPGFPLWKLISVWAIAAGALTIYSIDFIWDHRTWKLKGIPVQPYRLKIAWGWLVFSFILWIALFALVWGFLGWQDVLRLLFKLVSNSSVQLLVVGLVLYGLIISVLNGFKWLMVLILPWVVAMSLTFPVYSFKDFDTIINNGMVGRALMNQTHLFPWSIFSLLAMNILLVQFYERPKDAFWGNYNIWLRLPLLARLLWLGALVIFVLMSIFKWSEPLYEITWGEWFILIAYQFLLILGNFSNKLNRSKETEIKEKGKVFSNNAMVLMADWLRQSGYRFAVDLMLLGMILK